MKLGAQLYSLRTFAQNPEDLRETILKCKAMGYQNVQFSGVAYMEPEVWAEISRETEMEIVCTHNSFDRIVNDTDKLIEEHKVFGCRVIGLGGMPGEYRGSLEALERFFAVMEEPVRKIEAAGMHFGYHNHAFEFDKFSDADTCAYDTIIERCPTWHLILDTGWIQFAGHSAVEYIERIGGERLQNIHFKEFKCADRDTICPCGEGFSDFAAIVAACEKVGVKNALVEQDNAPMKDDPFGEMERSAKHLLPLIKA
ncbi:MAG: sugar phosphate isomerase/epimerase [Ruminococcaceae bacterium]|nr:sugar phosphate isomerase/epimerase [Oscillospiraceae bacterium]